jgi:hypothetical protein
MGTGNNKTGDKKDKFLGCTRNLKLLSSAISSAALGYGEQHLMESN